jgi:hypothetical protein
MERERGPSDQAVARGLAIAVWRPRARLRGREFTGLDLTGASLEGIDLRGARLAGCDLRGARLAGARLEGARFERVDLAGAELDGAAARHAGWRLCDLTGASVQGADLRDAHLSSCVLERARLDGTDLSRAYVLGCDGTGLGLRAARLEAVTAVGSSFHGADLEDARDFASTRELVVELLRRALPDADERFAEIVGAAATIRGWCYPEWSRRLAREPEQLRRVLDVMARHPRSGFADALAAGAERPPAARPVAA